MFWSFFFTQFINFCQDAQDLFHCNPVIFVPVSGGSSQSGGSLHQAVKGRMVGRDEVWWADGSGLFNKYRETLENFHSPLAGRHLLEPLYR